MPFINETSTRELTQSFGRIEEYKAPASFGEVFDASLGHVIDEELSISQNLNREGWDQREKLIRIKIDAGEIDSDKYRNNSRRSRRKGAFDYNRIAEELNDPEIKNDEQLNQERNTLLAQRRNYANDVIERGSGLAQFAGSMTGYMLDPINIATLGIATPITAVKAASTIGRIALASRNAALIEGATELAIQTFVFQHKQDIDSPYNASDALLAIGTAATGAAALGGTAEGLSGYFRRVLKLADKLPQTKDVNAAKKYIERLSDTIEKSRKSIDAMTDQDYEKFLKAQLAYANSKPIDVDRFKPNKKAIQESAIAERKTEIKSLLGEKPLDAPLIKSLEKELSDLDQGVITGELQSSISKSIDGQIRIADEEFLKIYHQRMQQYSEPSKVAAHYEEPEIKTSEPVTVKNEASKAKKADADSQDASPIRGVEQKVLDDQGYKAEFDNDLAAFKAIDEDSMVKVGDQQINAKEVIQQMDEEIDNLDSVLRCVYG